MPGFQERKAVIICKDGTSFKSCLNRYLILGQGFWRFLKQISLFFLATRGNRSVFSITDFYHKNCRLGKDFPMNANSGIFKCAVCQVDQPPAEGLTLNSGPFFSPSSKPWEGPFLCTNCRKKKDAMEGKRPSKPTVIT